MFKVIVFACLLLTASLIAFAYVQNITVALVLIMIGEAGMLAQIAATSTYVQTNVAKHMRGACS